MVGGDAAEGHYEEAAKVYRDAGDLEGVLRLYLGPLHKAREAADLARHSGTPSHLALVANARLEAGDPQVGPHQATLGKSLVGPCHMVSAAL